MRQSRCLPALAVFTLLGCVPDQDTPSVVEAELWSGELPIAQPWLRDHLPDQALVYARIPNILGLFATPKGNVMDPALRSKVNVENVEKIRQGLIQNVLPLLGDIADPNLQLMQRYVRSPIEVSGTFVPAPAGLIAATLDIDSNDEFDTALGELGLSLRAPLNAQNVGQVNVAGMSVQIQFDAATGRLLAQAGPGANEASFAKVIADLNRNEPHQMRSLESRIDESGQGLFLWANGEEAMPLLQMFMPRDRLQKLVDLGIERVSAVALGWGVANGKGRIAIAADVRTEDDRGFVPYVNNDLSAKSVGDPDGLFVLSIPTANEFSRLETLALEMASPEDKAEWLDGKAFVKESVGLSVEDILGAIGPEMLVILDEAGDYAALRLRDPDVWESFLTSVGQITGNPPEQKQVAGNTYYHWAMAPLAEQADLDPSAQLGLFGELWRRQRDHLYWMQDGEFLYLASVPQVLYDRVAMSPDTDVGEWLTTAQRIDGSSAFLSLSGTSRKLPKRMYTFYIEILHMLSDFAEADIDVWAMPSAAQLALPETGTMGFTINLGDPTLAAELTFENNPGELLGGVGTIAAVGVIAAIAIPAYSDYSTRAQIAEGINLTSATKTAIAEFYVSNGRFPGAAEAAELSIPENAGQHVWSIEVEPDTGMIIVEYKQSVASTGGQLFIEPMVGEDNQISWSCMGSFANKHMPAVCRN